MVLHFFIFWKMVMTCFKYILRLKDVTAWCSSDVKMLDAIFLIMEKFDTKYVDKDNKLIPWKYTRALLYLLMKFFIFHFLKKLSLSFLSLTLLFLSLLFILLSIEFLILLLVCTVEATFMNWVWPKSAIG